MKNTINKKIDYEFATGKRHGGSRKILSEDEMPLLFIIPLVETAWAHGAIARSEKQMIYEAARAEGIDERSLLNETLDELLTYQPGRQFFENCLLLIKNELAAIPLKLRGRKISVLVKRCRSVAAVASGSSAMDVNNFTSSEESEILTRLVSELNFRDKESPRERLPIYLPGRTIRKVFGAGTSKYVQKINSSD